MSNEFGGAEKRKHRRHEWREGVRLTKGNASADGQVLNVSMGGVLVHSELALGVGEMVVLEIQLPGLKEASSIECTVRWVDKSEGAGLFFQNLRAIETKAVSQLLISLSGT